MVGKDSWEGQLDVLRCRALYLPTFSHFLIVNKTSLSPCYTRLSAVLGVDNFAPYRRIF